MPQVSRVELVYQLNQLETAVLDIMIVARQGKTVLWKHSLLQAQSQVIPLLTTAPTHPHPTENKRARVRRAGSDNANVEKVDKDAQQS